MVTSPLPLVDPASVDTAGLSVITTTPTPDWPRAGTIYDPTLLAAAAPVWIHPLVNGEFLLICARRWFDATPHGTDAGNYSTYTEDTAPSWYIVSSAGTRRDVPNAVVHIPMKTTVDSAVVTAGASRPPNYVYLLNAVQIGGESQAVLQYFICSPNGAVVLAGEEVLPAVTGTTGTVVFDRGIQYDTPYLVLYGADADGKVYRLRKPWGKVGVNRPQPTPQVHGGVGGLQVGWQYYTGTGYSDDPSELAPLMCADTSTLTTSGPVLTTAGPMSFASYRTQVLMATVTGGADYEAQVWSSRSGRPFAQTGEPVALGSGANYLEGGLQFMSQLQANPAAPQMTSATAGVPYVVSSRVAAGGSARLQVSWSVWGIG